MVEGTLGIYWVNRTEPSAAQRYRLIFLPDGPGFPHGAQPQNEIVGEDNLLYYLVDLQAPSMQIERRKERVQKWILKIRTVGSLSLDNFQLTAEQFTPFRRVQSA
jgi:hypothetical protein